MSNVGRYVREWRGGPKYNKVGNIGSGAFATVYKVTAKFDGTPYAAKELEKRRFMKNGILDQKVDNEMKIMEKIKHVSIPSSSSRIFLMDKAQYCPIRRTY
jgi:serine/threonine protein kinase